MSDIQLDMNDLLLGGKRNCECVHCRLPIDVETPRDLVALIMMPDERAAMDSILGTPEKTKEMIRLIEPALIFDDAKRVVTALLLGWLRAQRHRG